MQFVWSMQIVFLSVFTAHSNLLNSSQELAHNHQFPIFEQNGWWELKKTDDPIFSGRYMESSAIFMRKSDADSNLIHTCYQFKVIETSTKEVYRSGQFCYPAIIITGVRKCSTSAAYALLSEVPGSIQLKFKENCPFIGWRSIVDYFESMPQQIGPGGLLIDGCVDLAGNMKMRQLLRQPETFYVVVLRDFADWIWSAYNYWCDTGYDDGCDVDSRWAKIGRHNRSAEAFDKIVQASVDGQPIASPLHFNNTCDKAHNFYRSYYDRLSAAGVNSDAFAVLTSEQLEAAPREFWDQLSAVAGLPKRHPAISAFKQFRYNVQSIDAKSRRGDHPELSKIEAAEHKPGLYEISQFQPLMQSTRSLLNKCWRDDCLWASNITGHQYASCAAEEAAPSTPGSEKAKHAHEQNVNPALGKKKGETSVGPFPGFLNHRVRQCHQLISAAGQLARSDTLKGSRVLLLSAESQLNEFVVLLLKAVFQADSIFSVGAGIGAGATVKGVDKGARQCGPELDQLPFVLASVIAVDGIVDNDALHNISNTTTFQQAGAAQGDPSVIGTSPVANSDSSLSVQVQGKYLARFKDGTTSCDRNSVSFDRVVFLEEDYFLQIWEDFVAQRGEAEAEVRANWTLWDEFSLAAPIIKQSDRIAKAVKAEDMLVLQLEGLVDGPTKFESLRRLLGFLGFATPSDDMLRCAYAVCLALMRGNDDLLPFFQRHRALKTKQEIVYSSDSLVCRRKQLGSLADDSNWRTHFYPDVICPSPPQPAHHSSRGCAIRYAQNRTFLAFKDRRQPVALVAIASQKVTNTRLLIEYASGFLTGAIKPDPKQAKLFPAEFNCGQRMPLIYTYPTHLHLEVAKKTGAPVAALHLQARANCAKGMIRGFTRFIILIDDPFAVIWKNLLIAGEEVNNTEAEDFKPTLETHSARSEQNLNVRNNPNHTNNIKIGHASTLANPTLLQRAIELSKEYSLQKLLGCEMAADIVEKFPPSAYLVMSDGYLAHADTRRHALEQLLAFTNVPMFPNSAECRHCSFALISGQHTRALGTAVRGMRQHHHILCAVKQEFAASNLTQFLGHSLFNDMKCAHQALIGGGKRSRISHGNDQMAPEVVGRHLQAETWPVARAG